MGECVSCWPTGVCLLPPPDDALSWAEHGLVLLRECVYMLIDPCYVIPLPSGMYVIPHCFLTLFPYIIPQRPEQLCIALTIAMYMPTWSPWTTTEPQRVHIRDSNKHTEATTIPVYISLHMARLVQ